MLIDTHAHLAHPFFKNRLEEIVSNAKENGVGHIVTIGCTIKEAQDSLALAEIFPDVSAAIGLYPRDIRDEPDMPLSEKLALIKEFSQNKKVVAIGECGLDFSPVGDYEIDYGETEQIDRFEKQIELAHMINKPLIIHSRDAAQLTLDTFSRSAKTRKQKAVWHCFSDGPDIAEQALSCGFHLSFTGNITYPKNIALRETVRMTPLEKIMIETDSPYLTPQAARAAGVKRNEPLYVRMVSEEIAEIKGISKAEVEETTTKNASSFFGIKF